MFSLDLRTVFWAFFWRNVLCWMQHYRKAQAIMTCIIWHWSPAFQATDTHKQKEMPIMEHWFCFSGKDRLLLTWHTMPKLPLPMKLTCAAVTTLNWVGDLQNIKFGLKYPVWKIGMSQIEIFTSRKRQAYPVGISQMHVRYSLILFIVGHAATKNKVNLSYAPRLHVAA